MRLRASSSWLYRNQIPWNNGSLREGCFRLVTDFAHFNARLRAVLTGVLGLIVIVLGLLLLLDTGDDSPCSTTTANGILVSHRKQVPLIGVTR